MLGTSAPSDVNMEAPASLEAARPALARRMAGVIADWEGSAELYEQLADRLIDIVLASSLAHRENLNRGPDHEGQS
jgi:hypothetical protein